MKKLLKANGFTIEFVIIEKQNLFTLQGTAKRAGRVMATDIVNGHKDGNWMGLFIPFSDNTVKMAQDELVKKLSKEADRAIANTKHA